MENAPEPEHAAMGVRINEGQEFPAVDDSLLDAPRSFFLPPAVGFMLNEFPINAMRTRLIK